MKLRRDIAIVGGLLLVYSLLVIFTHGSDARNTNIEGASDSSGPSGGMALVHTLEGCHIPVGIWEHPPVLLPGQSDTFLSIEPESSTYPEKQAKSVIDYAKSGHRVIWVTDKQDEVLNVLGVTLQPYTGSYSQKEQTIRGPGLLHGIATVDFSPEETIGVLPDKQGILRFEDPNGKIFGAVIPVGKGDFSVWVVPSVFENYRIGLSQNFAIPFAFIHQSPILMDEYGHGLERGTLFQAVFGHGRELSFILLVVSAILYVWSASVRLGSPSLAPDGKKRESVELLDALAWHFTRGPLQKDMLILASQAIKKRICTLTSCNIASDWSQIDKHMDKLPEEEIRMLYASWRQATLNLPHVRSRQLKKYNELTRQFIGALDAVAKERVGKREYRG